MFDLYMPTFYIVRNGNEVVTVQTMSEGQAQKHFNGLFPGENFLVMKF